MGILFRLGNTELGLIQIRYHLTQGVMNLLFQESNLFVRNRRVIIRKADKKDLFSLSSIKERKAIITETMTNFSCTIRTEIEENSRITILNLMRFSHI